MAYLFGLTHSINAFRQKTTNLLGGKMVRSGPHEVPDFKTPLRLTQETGNSVIFILKILDKLEICKFGITVFFGTVKSILEIDFVLKIRSGVFASAGNFLHRIQMSNFVIMDTYFL